MQFYSVYDQPNETRVADLVKTAPFSQLVTYGEGRCRVGIFNHVAIGRDFVLHLHRKDEQAADLKATNSALLSMCDFLSVIPSYWIDETYGGAATSYYRYAEWECRAEVIEDPALMREILQPLMDRFQPEGGYERLDPASETYRTSFATIAVVRLRPFAVRTKWKLGQNRPVETRLRVLHHLRERGLPGDLRAAAEISREIG